MDVAEKKPISLKTDDQNSAGSDYYYNSNNESNFDDEMAKSYKKPRSKAPWYYAPVFLLFWFVLFFAVTIPIFYYLPEALVVETEYAHPQEFIAERAEHMLFDFDIIGPKVVGSKANENITVQFLLDQVEKVRRVMHQDLYDLEVQVQEVSGAYMHWQMINMYQGLQNFVVKLSEKNSTDENYLLLNSHFDTKPGSPGAGDDGAMVVVMLEILRVLATSLSTFKHPIVFLFNGAEENPLQASHGFITQHPWAKHCKALINLDSAGSGNREILFQSGPNHPWLIDYYSKSVARPLATSLAEELFQSGILPSDTDFRIFRDYGNVPGLDLAHFYNGYVYHTKFDKFNVIPRGTLQMTGNNILALTRALSNAPELEDPSKHADGHAVFYDFLSLFFVHYTETQGKIINTCIAVAAILLVSFSLWRMAAISYMSICKVLRAFSLVLVLHIIGYVLAFGLPLLLAFIYDEGSRSMTWFTHKWLVIGLYICPTLFGLSVPTLLYLSFSRNDKLAHSFRLQMVLHAQSVILSILCVVLTFMGIRTSYLLMIPIFFYSSSLVLNILTTLHRRGYFWTIFTVASQVMPFLYISHLFFVLLCTLIPMMGRFGSNLNPDLLISVLCALGAVLAMGFLIPLLSLFRHSKLVLLSLPVITFIFCMLSLTYLGFPYRAKTNVERVNFLEVRRVFYERNGSVSKNESGFLFDFQDRRREEPLKSAVNLSELENIAKECEEYMMCGLPLFNHRWYNARNNAEWLPTKEPLELPDTPTLKLISRAKNATNNRAYFEFELSGGPPHMSLFLNPLTGITVSNWSFIQDMLEEPEKWLPPYHVFFTYGQDSSSLKFFIELKVPNGKADEALFELGISAHYVSFEYERSPEAKEFISSLPEYAFAMEWPSSYQRYIY